MKRFLTFLCLLASLVVLAPQTILAEESSSSQTTTKLDLSRKRLTRLCHDSFRLCQVY